MKNVLICGNCGKENAFFKLNCTGCRSFLRARIVNIDFWDTVWKIFYSPVSTAEKIIQAENKNYLVTSGLLTAFKFSLVSLMLLNFSVGKTLGDQPYFNGMMRGSLPFLISTLLFSIAVTFINKSVGIESRIKDNIAIYFFSFVPVNFSLFILAPIQFALFGEYWFTFNPSPFIMKPQSAIVIIILEFGMLIWSAFLFVASTYAQSKNKVYSAAVGLSGFFLILLSVLIFSFFAI